VVQISGFHSFPLEVIGIKIIQKKEKRQGRAVCD
jgi:hypothetical protein